MAEGKSGQRNEEGREEDLMPEKVGDITVSSQTKECIESYIQDPLQGFIKLASSEKTIACIDYISKKNTLEGRLCRLLKSRDIHGEYFGIKNCISTQFFKQACLVDENIDTFLTKATAISTLLDSSLDAIKVAKTKLWEIREAACKLDAARNDSCNSEQLSAMSKIPQAGPEVGNQGIARFQSLVDGIITAANGLYDAVDDTFEKGVKVAGIQAYMNVGSLKPFSATLKEDAENFDKDIEANLDFSEEQLSTAQEAYTEDLQSVDACLFVRSAAHLNSVSLEAMQIYAQNLSEQDCQDRTSELEHICNEIKEIFQADIECSNP